MFISAFVTKEWAQELFTRSSQQLRLSFLFQEVFDVLRDPKIHPDFGFKGKTILLTCIILTSSRLFCQMRSFDVGVYESRLGRDANRFFREIGRHEYEVEKGGLKLLLLGILEIAAKKRWTRVGQQVVISCIHALAATFSDVSRERKTNQHALSGETGEPHALLVNECEEAIEHLKALHRSAASHFSSRYRRQLDELLLSAATLFIPFPSCPAILLASLLCEIPRDTLFDAKSLNGKW